MSENKDLIQAWGNDEKRQAFLKAYKDWGVWFTVPETEWTLYRYVLPNGTVIIALEYRRDPKYYSKEQPGVLYYTQYESNFICPGSTSSIWHVAVLLKTAKAELQKKVKNSQEEK
jgi:hypothetical protein